MQVKEVQGNSSIASRTVAGSKRGKSANEPPMDTEATSTASAPKTIEIIQAENERLKAENETLKQQLADLDRRLEFWRTRFDQPVPGNEEELKKFLYEAGRGKPKCQEQNTLVSASVIDGNTTITILNEAPFLRTALQEQGITLTPGASITSQEAISAVLDLTQNPRRPTDNKECRFDYIFKYRTNDDYHDGNERFERYFYTIRRTRVP